MPAITSERVLETGRETTNRAVALVQWVLARSPVVPGRAPTSADDVTAEFLTSVFAGSGPPGTVTAADQATVAAVEGIEQVGETRGTTNRRRLKLTWNPAGRDAGLPERVFVKITSTSARNRTQVASLDMAVNESKFYSTARNDLGDVAPVAYYSTAGLGGRFLLLLEDLWEADHPPFKGPGEAVEFCRAMMSTLAELHATFWESPRFHTDLSWAKTMTQRKGFPIMRGWFRRSRAKLYEEAADYGLPSEIQRLAKVLNDHDRELYKVFERGPLTLLHGDCHLGNTYRLPDRRAGLLDWQCMFRGPHMREVIYHLSSALLTPDRRNHEEELVGFYLDELRARGAPAPSFDDAWDQYRFYAWDVWDANAMTILWPGLQPEHHIEKTLKHASEAIVDLDTLKMIDRTLNG